MSEYIYYFLLWAKDRIESSAPGTTFKEVSGRLVSLIVVPLPPLHTQKEIVSLLDSYLIVT